MTPQSDDAAFRERLAHAAARIEPVLEELLPRGAAEFLSEAIWYHLESGGKRIRPAICLLTCESLGGDSSRALHVAAAVEILHNTLLIHDDLEDGDTVRRDREAVWVRYGLGNAVNVGDYLFGAASRAILRSPLPAETVVRLLEAFTDAYETTCRGQALDMNWRARPDLTVEDYLRMVTLKTGRYMAIGMVGGAIVAGQPVSVQEAIGRLGDCMGAAFQIRDDLIDLTAGKGRGGMTGNDIREGKCSILYVHALSGAGPGDRADLVRIMAKSRQDTTDADVERVRGIYERCGSVEFARREADCLVQRAYETIETIPVGDKAFFRRLTSFMVERAT
jgi:geranylgeranyl pyrophosphate synthase